jgi:tetratricopeptide (TPR) repeat protein
VDEQRSESLLAEAHACATERRWHDAATRFARAGAKLAAAGKDAQAERAWAAGGDAAWRADLPDLAMRCLVRSRERLDPGGLQHGARSAQIAGVLLELGELDSASLILDEVAETGPARELEMVLLDVRLSLDLLRGKLGHAHERLGRLESLVGEEGAPVLLYRQGQLMARLGQLGEAAEALAACVAIIEERQAYDGPRGAALLELGEIAMFREEHDDALALLDAAARAWKSAGRSSGVHRAEAARMRLLGAMGMVETLTSGLDRALAFAQERELLLLETELCLASGICEAARDPVRSAAQLDRAVQLASDMGAVTLRGRALLARHDRSGGRRESLELACLDLVEIPTWRSRAYLALARALSHEPGGRAEALEICATALCRFSSMGLAADESRARGLLWRISAGK